MLLIENKLDESVTVKRLDVLMTGPISVDPKTLVGGFRLRGVDVLFDLSSAATEDDVVAIIQQAAAGITIVHSGVYGTNLRLSITGEGIGYLSPPSSGNDLSEVLMGTASSGAKIYGGINSGYPLSNLLTESPREVCRTTDSAIAFRIEDIYGDTLAFINSGIVDIHVRAYNELDGVIFEKRESLIEFRNHPYADYYKNNFVRKDSGLFYDIGYSGAYTLEVRAIGNFIGGVVLGSADDIGRVLLASTNAPQDLSITHRTRTGLFKVARGTRNNINLKVEMEESEWWILNRKLLNMDDRPVMVIASKKEWEFKTRYMVYGYPQMPTPKRKRNSTQIEIDFKIMEA